MMKFYWDEDDVENDGLDPTRNVTFSNKEEWGKIQIEKNWGKVKERIREVSRRKGGKRWDGVKEKDQYQYFS